MFPTRLERGAGLPNPERLAYIPEMASSQLQGLRHLILVDAKAPVSFFAYPGKKSSLVPEGCEVLVLASSSDDVSGSLRALEDAVGAAGQATRPVPAGRPERPTGELTADKVCQAVAAVLPEGAILSEEAVTSGATLAAATAGCPRHDVLTLTGGAIGQGLPVAVGAAVACPDRPVLALQADGSALYTIQSLWTMAREELDITVILFNNQSYAILNMELARVGAKAAGPKAKSQLDLSRPELDFVSIARGFGVPAERPDTAEGLTEALERAISEPGPHLIEAVVPARFTPFQLKAMPYALRALEVLPQPMAKVVKRRLAP